MTARAARGAGVGGAVVGGRWRPSFRLGEPAIGEQPGLSFVQRGGVMLVHGFGRVVTHPAQVLPSRSNGI